MERGEQKPVVRLIGKIKVFVRFGCVGALNTILTNATYLLILFFCGYSVIKGNVDVPTWLVAIATVAGQVVGLINSYFGNKYFTFRQKIRSKWEMVRFALLFVAMFGIDFGIKLALKQHTGLNQIFIVLITLLCIIPPSFLGQRFFVFGRWWHRKRLAAESLPANTDAACTRLEAEAQPESGASQEPPAHNAPNAPPRE